MAVDSRDKRMSLIGFGLPVPWVFPEPDGAISVNDRAMYLFLYHGLDITSGAPVWLRTGGVPYWRAGPRQLGGRTW